MWKVTPLVAANYALTTSRSGADLGAKARARSRPPGDWVAVILIAAGLSGCGSMPTDRAACRPANDRQFCADSGRWLVTLQPSGWDLGMGGIER